MRGARTGLLQVIHIIHSYSQRHAAECAAGEPHAKVAEAAKDKPLTRIITFRFALLFVKIGEIRVRSASLRPSREVCDYFCSATEAAFAVVALDVITGA